MDMSERPGQLRNEFVAARGYWNDSLEALLGLDADFFEAYLRLSAVPWRTGSLEPKVKEFIYTAFDASATHLYVPGLRQHVQNALGYGATAAEIMEVFELASVLGIQTCALGIPILLEEAARAGAGG